MDYTLRQNKLLDLLGANSLDALLIRKKQNISYLVGTKGEDAVLFISHEGNLLITDSRYREEYARSIRHCPLKITDGNSIYAHIDKASRQGRSRRIGFEADHFSYSEIAALKKKLKARPLRQVKGMVESLRIVKDRDEIRCIEEACKTASDTMNYAIKITRPFISEGHIKNKIEAYIARKGIRKAGFDIIVASGKNSSMPHGSSSNDKIQKGEMVIIDLGTTHCGYSSDLTRTIFLGRIDRKYRRIYAVVLEAQKRAIDRIKPGAQAGYIDNISRQYISDRGFGKYFIHSLGHGIGLEGHEAPRISKDSGGILKRDMVITIEPGIYIPGWGGVRIEDTIRITDGGCEILTKRAKKILCN